MFSVIFSIMVQNIKCRRMSEDLLPLFPLPVVLFPSSILQLHIFEDRYKQLIDECVQENKPFGINLIHENLVSKIGCSATVTQTLRKYDDGRMDILVQGQRRYRLRQFVTAPVLYSVASIAYQPDSNEPVDNDLATETIKLHNQLVLLVYRNASYVIEYVVPDISFRIAQKAGMDLAHRQKLLESNSENERLEMLRQYFLQVMPKLKHLGEIERVIRSDGYIVNS